MKILYIQGNYNFCYYYRGYLPGIYSNQTVVPENIRGEEISSERLMQKAMISDVICFQRPTSEEGYELARLLKKSGKKIIMDTDDTYSGIPLHRLGNEKRVALAVQINKNLHDFAKLADGIIVSTQFLAKEYSELNPNVAILKNCIDPYDEFTCKENTTGKFRIGIIGSVMSNDDCNEIRDQIKQLDDRDDVTLVLLGIKLSDGRVMAGMQEDYDFWSTLKNTEWHPGVNVTEYMFTISQLALDLAIIPRKEHYFNQCKSNLKFLEMSLLSIPVLAQGFSDDTSPYQGIDEEYMSIVVDNKTWYNRVMKIKEKHSDYKLLARKAHDYVLENYNIHSFADEWTKQIIKLLTK